MVVGKQQVEQEQDAERDDEVLAHDLFHPGPQHLDHHLASAVCGPVHLAERGGGQRTGLEPLEELPHVASELLAHHLLGDAGGQRRHLVGEGTDGREVGLGQDVRPGSEHLGQLDERGAEVGERPGESLRTAAVALRVAPSRAPDDEEPAPVQQECQHERKQPAEDDECAH